MTAAATERKIEWVREAAGDRFGQIELNTIVPTVEITDDRRAAAERLAADLPVSAEEVLDSPAVLLGTVDEIAETLAGAAGAVRLLLHRHPGAGDGGVRAGGGAVGGAIRTRSASMASASRRRGLAAARRRSARSVSATSKGSVSTSTAPTTGSARPAPPTTASAATAIAAARAIFASPAAAARLTPTPARTGAGTSRTVVAGRSNAAIARKRSVRQSRAIRKPTSATSPTSRTAHPARRRTARPASAAPAPAWPAASAARPATARISFPANPTNAGTTDASASSNPTVRTALQATTVFPAFAAAVPAWAGRNAAPRATAPIRPAGRSFAATTSASTGICLMGSRDPTAPLRGERCCDQDQLAPATCCSAGQTCAGVTCSGP